MATIAAIFGRLCIAALFVISGLQKVMFPVSTADFITSHSSLPGTLAMPTGIFEIVAGVLLGLGFMTRLVSIVLAGFVVLATLFFHNQITDPMVAQQALKNLAIFGGLLMVFAYGQVSWRMDTWKERDRRHDAEVALARAEARADAAEARPAVVERDAPRTVVVERDAEGRTFTDRHDGDPRT